MQSQAEKDIDFAMKTVNTLGKYVGKYFYNCDYNLTQNAQNIFSHNFPNEHLQRQKPYKDLIINKIKKIFNENELNNFDLESIDGLTINICDHHGILNHPWLYTANMISHFDRLFTKNRKAIPIITLDCGNCPLSEPFHKRGLEFHDVHVNLFPKSKKRQLVYTMPKTDISIMEKVVEYGKHTEFNEKELELIKKIDQIIQNLDYSDCEKYSHQITKINYYLWPLLFEEKQRDNLIDLVTLEHDEILVEFLIEFLQDESTFIFQMMFDKDFRDIVLNKFRGKYSAWDEDRNYGTHFFWYINEKGIQERMYLNKNEELVSENGSKIKFNKNEIIKLLMKKQLIPSMFVKFSTIVCYLGCVPMGGFGSVNYISTLKELWLEIMPEKFSKEKELLKQVPTQGIITTPFAFEKNNGELKELFAFDMFYKGGFTKEYLDKVNQMRLDELMRPGLEFCYNYYTNLLPENERVKIKFDKKAIHKPFEKLFV